jgi:hypothetical protein
VARIAARLLQQRGALRQIGARRENLAVARQHDGAHVDLGAEHVEDPDDLFAKLAILRVHRRRCDRQRGDVIGDVDAEAFERFETFHGAVLSKP